MLKEIFNEVEEVIDSSFSAIAKEDYLSYVLFIGRADFIPGLKTHVGTDCVIDYQLDRYFDQTREAFYIHYLRRNYSKEDFRYIGESGIDDLSIEMMIYCHLWDSRYFLKSIYRLAAILDGKGYQWSPNIPENGKYSFINDNIISPLQEKNINLGSLVSKAFNSNIRNAFAHSSYNVSVEAREIYTRTRLGYHTYSFEEFQRTFLYSVILMYMLHNYLETNHNAAAEKNNALTDAFYTPDGLKVQVYGQMITRSGKLQPELSLVRIHKPNDYTYTISGLNG